MQKGQSTKSVSFCPNALLSWETNMEQTRIALRIMVVLLESPKMILFEFSHFTLTCPRKIKYTRTFVKCATFIFQKCNEPKYARPRKFHKYATFSKLHLRAGKVILRVCQRLYTCISSNIKGCAAPPSSLGVKFLSLPENAEASPTA